jgi:hypothetical protein
LSNFFPVEGDTVVVIGYRHHEEVKTIGSVKGIAVNNEGKTQVSIALSDTMNIKNGCYKLVV